MSRVSCHVSRVTCQVSHVILFFIFFLQSCEACQWRVCHQRGLPRLVSPLVTTSQLQKDGFCLVMQYPVHITNLNYNRKQLLLVFCPILNFSYTRSSENTLSVSFQAVNESQTLKPCLTYGIKRRTQIYLNLFNKYIFYTSLW